MYKINFNHLYYFLTIANEGSIVRASKKLNMTQPTLSHQLKSLELDLGKKLFDRKGKRLVLNKSGEAVKEYANKIFRHSEEMLHSLNSNNEEYIKIVKVGIVSWLPKDFIYQFIKPLIAIDHIKVEVYQKDHETLLKDINNKDLDIILCDSPYSGRSKKLIGQILKLDKIFCVSSPSLKLKGKFPESIQGKKMINYSESCLIGDRIENFLRNNKIKTKTVGSFSDTALMRTTIEKSRVIGFLPYYVIKESLRDKKLKKVAELDSLKFSLWAITNKTSDNNNLLSLLVSKFKK